MNFVLICLLGFASFAAWAHPVIFKDGTVISSSNMAMYGDNQVSYSFHEKWAAGINHFRFSKDEQDTDFGFSRVNHLLKRWNGESSQANIYLAGGVGMVDQRDSKIAYMGGIEADWETRTLYSSLKHYQFSSPSFTDIGMSQVRLGASPYETDFDKLQTWFMVQGMYMGKIERTVIITPMLRFFYQNVLWEVGSSFKGDWMMNFMVHL